MRAMFAFWTVALCQVSLLASAELNLNYSYLKRSFDELNWFANQSTSVGISIFFAERLALELSYTNGLYVKKEKESASLSSLAQRTTTQFTNMYDAGVILLLAGRQAIVQPYIKLGGALIQRRQEVQIDNDIPFIVTPIDAFSPSGGIGLRIIFSERLALRMSYELVQTPLESGQSLFDSSGRAGLTWMF